jgi:hypothetical protein
MFLFIPSGLTHKHQGKTKIHLKSEPNWLDFEPLVRVSITRDNLKS